MVIYQHLYKSFGPQHWWPAETPFEVMVGAILTQNTNWQNVIKAIENLKKAGLMAPAKLLRNRRRIPELIKSSGFYQLKTKRLVSFLEYYVGRYNGDVENFRDKSTMAIREELLTIPGIGKETADSILLYALNRPIFVVDAYTRRIFGRHKIFNNNSPYDEIRLLFESNLSQSAELYNEYHALLVRLGKEYCRKDEALCSICPLYNLLA